MRFENLNLLWLLVLPVLLALFYWWRERVKRQLLAKFIEARLLSQLTVGISLTRRRWRFGLMILAVACLVVALAQPERGYDLEEVEQNGLDVVVAIDTSKSMLATDIAPNRLERAKLAALTVQRFSTCNNISSAFLKERSRDAKARPPVAAGGDCAANVCSQPAHSRTVRTVVE